jgi:hypothetical protein
MNEGRILEYGICYYSQLKIDQKIFVKPISQMAGMKFHRSSGTEVLPDIHLHGGKGQS